MPYIYCDRCGIGLHSNVLSCPHCGAPTRLRHHHVRFGWGALRLRARVDCPRDDVENEVREAIYGWRSGSVER